MADFGWILLIVVVLLFIAAFIVVRTRSGSGMSKHPAGERHAPPGAQGESDYDDKEYAHERDFGHGTK